MRYNLERGWEFKTMRSKKYKQHVENLKRDLIFVLASIVLSFILIKTGVLAQLFSLAGNFNLLGSFISGIFFTSTFTIAPASIALAELGTTTSPLLVALFGACGAVVGDLVIFFFLKDSLTQDLQEVIKASDYKKVLSFFHLGFVRVLSPIIGALIIASPLPDELGLAMMGMSKVKPIYVVPICFIMNFLGILGIISIAQVLR